MYTPIPVTVLGATGVVGQRFIQLLDQHPYFIVTAITGSERSVGNRYAEACRWVLPTPMPEQVRDLRLLPSEAEKVQTPLAFSALPAATALQVEMELAKAGVVVCSNASAYRDGADVPILLPEVNPEHLQIVPIQRKKRGWRGAIVTNANCTSTGMSVALKALQQAFGLRRVFMVSLQAISGAGYPGVASLDILDNVLPFIDGEEEKLEFEPRKILGNLSANKLELADFSISAHCNRVPVSEGHLVCLTLELDRGSDSQVARQVLMDYRLPPMSAGLPSSPKPVILVRDEADRPQPRLDRDTGKGMTTVVGRIRNDPQGNLKLAVLSHNTIRGAAGGSIYNAELMVKEGYFS